MFICLYVCGRVVCSDSLISMYSGLSPTKGPRKWSFSWRWSVLFSSSWWFLSILRCRSIFFSFLWHRYINIHSGFWIWLIWWTQAFLLNDVLIYIQMAIIHNVGVNCPSVFIKYFGLLDLPKLDICIFCPVYNINTVYIYKHILFLLHESIATTKTT